MINEQIICPVIAFYLAYIGIVNVSQCIELLLRFVHSTLTRSYITKCLQIRKKNRRKTIKG